MSEDYSSDESSLDQLPVRQNVPKKYDSANLVRPITGLLQLSDINLINNLKKTFIVIFIVFLSLLFIYNPLIDKPATRKPLNQITGGKEPERITDYPVWNNNNNNINNNNNNNNQIDVKDNELDYEYDPNYSNGQKPDYERERREREERERQQREQREREERERQQRERREREERERQQREKEQREKEERERLERERLEAEENAKLNEEQRKIREKQQREQREKEERERKGRERLEAERKKKEEDERLRLEEIERLRLEEIERLQLEADEKAKKEAERLRLEEIERLRLEEIERLRLEEEERKRKEAEDILKNQDQSKNYQGIVEKGKTDFVWALTSSTYSSVLPPLGALISNALKYVGGKYVKNNPGQAITNFMEAGKCFAFAGNAGNLTLDLRESTLVKGVSIEHPETGHLESAPKSFSILGFQEKNAKKNIHHSFVLANDLAFPKSIGSQFYLIPKPQDTRYIQFKFTDNHGDSSHTCIYRVNVYVDKK